MGDVKLPEMPPSPTKTFYITNRMKERQEESQGRKSKLDSRTLSRASLKTPMHVSRRKKNNTPKVFDPEAPYDFDFDEEQETPLREKYSTQRDQYRAMYKKACKRMGLVPRKRIIHQIGDSVMSVKDLDLTHRELKAMMTAIINDESVLELDLSGNVLGVKDINYIIQLIKNNKTLSTLCLSSCRLCGAPIRTLAEFLKSSNSLRHLTLSDNNFDDKDAVYLAKIVEFNESIGVLNLSHNRLGDGAIIIGNALKENEIMTTIDLSWNHIRGPAAIGIGRGLENNTKLLNVHLGWNGFAFEGSIALANALIHNSTMQVLDVTCNRIHPPALFELLKGIEINKTLAALRIGLNPITTPMTSIMLSRIYKFKECGLKELDIEGCVVDKDFKETLELLQKERLFAVRYDLALPMNKQEIRRVDPANVFNIDPVRILFFMKEHLRTIDLFLKIDKDSSSSLTREEMQYAFELEGYPISSAALDSVMGYLDTNKDGEVDLLVKEISEDMAKLDEKYPGNYSEFISGERKLKRKLIKEREENANTPSTPTSLNVNKQKYSQTFEKPKSSYLPKIGT